MSSTFGWYRLSSLITVVVGADLGAIPFKICTGCGDCFLGLDSVRLLLLDVGRLLLTGFEDEGGRFSVVGYEGADGVRSLVEDISNGADDRLVKGEGH